MTNTTTPPDRAGAPEDLRGYLQHKAECARWMRLDDGMPLLVPATADIPEHATCTCGLQAILDRLTAQEVQHLEVFSAPDDGGAAAVIRPEQLREFRMYANAADEPGFVSRAEWAEDYKALHRKFREMHGVLERAVDLLTSSVRQIEELKQEKETLAEAVDATRQMLAGLSLTVGYLPEQGGYSTTQTAAEQQVSQAVRDLTQIIANLKPEVLPDTGAHPTAREGRPQADAPVTDIGADPNCRHCRGTGESPNAQFRCPCRWSHHRAGSTEWGQQQGYGHPASPQDVSVSAGEQSPFIVCDTCITERGCRKAGACWHDGTREQQLRPQASVSPWRDIASAPTDLNRALVSDGDYVVLGEQWSNTAMEPPPDPEERGAMVWTDEDGLSLDPQPTHWMPLPPPPAGKDA